MLSSYKSVLCRTSHTCTTELVPFGSGFYHLMSHVGASPWRFSLLRCVSRNSVSLCFYLIFFVLCFLTMAALGAGFQDPLESRTDSSQPLHSWTNSSCRWTPCPTLSIFSFLPGQIRLKTENMGTNPGSEGSSDVPRQLDSLNLQFLVSVSFL